MTQSSIKIWFHRLFPALVLAALIACGGNKKTGDTNAAAPELNADNAPKVSTTDNSGKDTSTGNENDICDKNNDAYAMYAKATFNEKDAVMKKAKEVGFDAIYTAKPATYTIEDYKVMHNYFMKTDLAYAKLSVGIEFKMAAAQKYVAALASATKESIDASIELNGVNYVEKDRDRFSDLKSMMEARRNLFNYYANMFGMANAISWFDGKELDDQLAAATKETRDKLAANTFITAAKKAEVNYGYVTAAKGVVMQVKEGDTTKDFVLHATYVEDKAVDRLADKRNFGIDVVEVNAQNLNFGIAYKDYKDSIESIATLEKAYAKRIEDVEAEYTANYKTEVTATAKVTDTEKKAAPVVDQKTTITATATTDKADALIAEYVELTAQRDLLGNFVGYFGFSRERGGSELAAPALRTNSDTSDTNGGNGGDGSTDQKDFLIRNFKN